MPDSTPSARLWLSADDSGRFFRIPEGTALPEGDFGIRSMDGRTRAVDPVALDIFEIDAAAARAALGERLGNALSTTRRVLEGISAAAAQRRTEGASSSARTGPRLSDDPRATMAEGLGLDRDTLTEDPQAFLAALQRLAADVGTAAAEVRGDEQAARARFARIAEALREAGDEDAAAAMDAVPDRLRDALASPEAEARIRAGTEKLQQLAAGMRARTAAARAAREQAAEEE